MYVVVIYGAQCVLQTSRDMFDVEINQYHSFYDVFRGGGCICNPAIPANEGLQDLKHRPNSSFADYGGHC